MNNRLYSSDWGDSVALGEVSKSGHSALYYLAFVFRLLLSRFVALKERDSSKHFSTSALDKPRPVGHLTSVTR